jgi:membrane protein YdbS with pleckstrin-like domain
VVVVSEIFARMSYNRWFYDFTGEGLRIERGIIWKRYSNIPYERIQNVDIHRGIIARMLGFSSLMIQTAGYSARARAEGNLPALDVVKAEDLRKFVMNKITHRRRR